jgi:hypothetical protein
MVPVPRSSRCPYTLLLIELPTPIFIVAQRSSRCPYSLLLIELPTPVEQQKEQNNLILIFFKFRYFNIMI